MKRTRAAALAVFLVLLAALPARAQQPRAAIVQLLETSTAGWNRGDLDAFLVPYAENATFVGSRGLQRGKAAIRAAYVASYFGPGRTRGTLRFADIEVRSLGPRHALAVGRYILTERGEGKEDATGIFSLTLEHRSEGWRIIHDHSS